MSEEALLEAEAKRRGISVTQLQMQMAVPDDLIRDIVADSRKGISQSASMISTSERAEPPRRTNGWIEAKPLAPPPGIALVDRLCEAQDARDRRRRKARNHGPHTRTQGAALRGTRQDYWANAVAEA
jgi:hypothetical protein